MRIKFTAGRVEAFECPTGKTQAFLWDTESKGLGLKASPGGAKKYVLESRLQSGKTVRLTIGDPKAWTISAAQIEARRLQSLIDQGLDPRELAAEKERQTVAANAEQAALARRETVVLADVWPLYIEARRHTWGERHLKDHGTVAGRGGQSAKRGGRTTGPAPLAALLDVKLTDLTGERIAAWLANEAQTRPTSTALAFRLLRGCLNWCHDERPDLGGILPPDALKSRKIRDALPKKVAKDDCLQREQLPSWFDQVRKIPNPVISAYLQGLLLTGARREELGGLTWADVDFQWRSLTMRDKVEGQRIIPLTPYLSSLLSNLPRRNEWVFSSPTAASGRLAEPRIAHNKALLAAGLPELTLHGLRRSFKTLSEWVEVPVGITAQIMGHKPSATAEKHYVRRPIDLLRVWHDKIEAWTLEQAGIKFDPAEARAGLRVVATA